jgi:hypothetical protein
MTMQRAHDEAMGDDEPTLPEKPRRRSFSAEYKMGILERYDACVGDGDKGALLRQEGLYSSHMLAGLRELDSLAGKDFFILVDEYEKLEDYQQVVLNTLVKQSGEHYCFKIGVRELGLRTRETLSPNEHLVSPADFSLIDVDSELDGDRFQEFAADVCNQRLARLSPGDDGVIRDVENLLPGLSPDEEAEALGVGPIKTRSRSERCQSP